MTGAEVLERINIVDVGSALGAPKLRGNRWPAFWRETKDYNVAIDRAKGTWYDHARNQGGGVLDLVCHVVGGSRADALRWCANLAGVSLEDDRPSDPIEMFDPVEALHFRDALLGHVERWLADCSAALWSDDDADPPQSVQDRVRELTCLRTTLRTCSAREVGAVYVTARKQNPQWASSLVRVGADEDANARFWTTVCVRLLEAAGDRPEHSDAWEPCPCAAPPDVLFAHHPTAELAA